VERDINADVEIYNGETGQYLYRSELQMVRGTTYFIGILPEIPFDSDPNFFNFQVKIYEHSKLIHNEKIHLKLN
jgi:hypothetical protein